MHLHEICEKCVVHHLSCIRQITKFSFEIKKKKTKNHVKVHNVCHKVAISRQRQMTKWKRNKAKNDNKIMLINHSN